MRRYGPGVRRNLAILVLILVVGGAGLLIGVSLRSGEGDPASGLTIRNVDWSNRSYDVGCGENDGPIQLVDGEWAQNSTDELYVEPRLTLGRVTYHDLIDGKSDEAIVELGCTYGANSSDGPTFVYTWRDGAPIQIDEPVYGGYLEVTEGQPSFVLWEESPLPEDLGCCPSSFTRTVYGIAHDQVVTLDLQLVDAEDTPFYETGSG